MQRTDKAEEGIMRFVFRMFCGLFVLMLVGAVCATAQPPKQSDSTPVAKGNVVVVGSDQIEFITDNAGECTVKHNGVQKGKAKKLKNVELTINHEDGSSIKPLFVPDSSLVYKFNPTCAAYWDGRSWNQYCW